MAVEAEQFTEENREAMNSFIQAIPYVEKIQFGQPILEIKVFGCWWTVHIGDWIIKNVDGVFLPVRFAVFEDLYEEVKRSKI